MPFQQARVTWAFCGPSCSSYYGAGIHTIAYKNYYRCYSSDSDLTCYNDLKPGGAYASSEALGADCSTPEYDSTYGGGYQVDPSTNDAVSIAEAQVGSATDLSAVFADDTATTIGLSSYPICGYSAGTWIANMNSLNQTVGAHFGIQVWPNGLSPGIVSGATLSQQASLSAAGPNVPGAMCESCLLDNNGPVTGSTWVNEENTAIDVVSEYGKIFWAYLRNGATPSTANFNALRLYGYASFLLTYDPNHSMLETAFDGSTFTVMPEAGLVPMLPVTTAAYPSSVSTYAVNGGAYMREWTQCYYGGTLLDKCAVVVNPTSSTVAVSSGYTHSLMLNGSDDYTSNCPTTWPTPCVSITGPAVTSLGPGTAAILFP